MSKTLVVQMSQAAKSENDLSHGAGGDLIALVDGKNQVTKWNYDEYGRVTNNLDQVSAEILRYKYDPDSRLTNR